MREPLLGEVEERTMACESDLSPGALPVLSPAAPMDQEAAPSPSTPRVTHIKGMWQIPGLQGRGYTPS